MATMPPHPCAGLSAGDAPEMELWEGVTFHLTRVVAWMVPWLIGDQIFRLINYMSKGRILAEAKTRWFALHALANFMVAVLGLPDIYFVLKNPYCGMMFDIISWHPSHIAFSIHLYHLLAFSDLRLEDVTHHLLFVGLFGIVNFTMKWGPVVNFLLFFITGVPGGLNYVLLVLKKEGKISQMEQKRLYSQIDVWMRMPGLLFIGFNMLSSAIQGYTRVPAVASVMCFILAAGNGVYYMEQTCCDYYTRLGAQTKKDDIVRPKSENQGTSKVE